VSPDGNSIAVDVKKRDGFNEIWVLDLLRSAWRLITTDQNDWQPRWTDDRTLIFLRGRNNKAAVWDVYTVSAAGNGTPTPLASFPNQVASVAVEPRGSAIVFLTVDDKRRDLWFQPLRRDGKVSDQQARRLFDTPSAAEAVLPCGFSPDGHWLAYSSDATGRREIYVTDSAGSVQISVSNAGGSSACWSKDGRQIFYWRGNTLMAVTVDAGEKFEVVEKARELFDSPLTYRWGYDVGDNVFYVAGYGASRSSSIVFVPDITAALPSGAQAH
jgi:Tol biopolymer transport system component